MEEIDPMMEDKHYEGKVREFLMREVLFCDGSFPYGDDASLIGEGIVDSMGVLELVEFVQSAFDLRVRPEEVVRNNFDSVNRIAAYVRAKQAKGMEVS